MSERKQYTDDQLDEITHEVWGEGRFQRGTSEYRVPCPVCGSDIRVYVDPTLRRPPPKFRAICSVCGIDSSGEATDVEMRQLTEEEIEEIVELHRHGERPVCPACSSPMHIEELGIAGGSSPHYVLTCWRCGTRGQRSSRSSAERRP